MGGGAGAAVVHCCAQESFTCGKKKQQQQCICVYASPRRWSLKVLQLGVRVCARLDVDRARSVVD